MGRLDGKVAIVTGAGGGIGREHCLLLAREGARVVVDDLGYRRSADPDLVVAEIEESGGAAVATRASATWAGAEEIVEAALTRFGRVDILVNNATTARTDDLWRMSEEVWDLTMDVNLKGYFAMIRAVAPHLCRQGSGAIVNTSSGAGFGNPGNLAYATAKEGVVGLTRTVARELGRFGVRCNAIRPLAAGRSYDDYVRATAKWDRLMELTAGPEPGLEYTPGIDPAVHTPDRVAAFVVWLCTDAAAAVNGRTFSVGGETISLLADELAEATVHRPGGWDLDGLDEEAISSLTAGLENRFALTGHPELTAFED